MLVYRIIGVLGGSGLFYAAYVTEKQGLEDAALTLVCALAGFSMIYVSTK